MIIQVLGKVYQGYYNDFYLRSSYECVFLKILEKKGLPFTMEEKTYEFLDGTKYTPDFFIYDDAGVLQRIVEIKAEDKQYYAEGVETVKKMKEEYNISIDLLSLQELIQICKENDLNFYQLSQEWKESPNSTYKKDNRGERNPMFGKHQSETSKQKNGEKTTERFQNEEFRKKHSEAVKRAMQNVPHEKLAFKNRSKNKTIVCCLCGKEEKVYTSQAVYCNACREKYTPWQRTQMRKKLLENVC